jgi:putative ABC transport system ATP-binding protein
MGDAQFIQARGLSKVYGETHALRDVDLDVPSGQWLTVMGPSGSGKSTLLGILGGLMRPSSGTALIGGDDLTAMDEGTQARFRRERVGLIFQQHHLVPYLTATENVMLAQYFHSMTDEAEASQALDRVGLSPRLRHMPNELSGGEQQRVCIARALINDPPLLLADEPTGSLDRASTENVLSILADLHEQACFTLLVVTHDPFVASWGERTVTLEDGALVSDETAPARGRTSASGAATPESRRKKG